MTEYPEHHVIYQSMEKIRKKNPDLYFLISLVDGGDLVLLV